jgi:hypothetical protein
MMPPMPRVPPFDGGNDVVRAEPFGEIDLELRLLWWEPPPPA